MTSNSEILALAEHHLGTDNKKGPAFARKSFMIMARPSGFEPETFASGGQRSIQLSYGRINTLFEKSRGHAAHDSAVLSRFAPSIKATGG